LEEIFKTLEFFAKELELATFAEACANGGDEATPCARADDADVLRLASKKKTDPQANAPEMSG
jgi:hypothetical protein